MDALSTSTVALRPVEDADMDALFEQMRDPVAVQMAAFTPDDPDDREAFDARMTRALSSPHTIMRVITCDGQLVGSIASFVMDGDHEVTYWIDRAAWGRHIAGRALAQFLDIVPTRPLHARVAGDNTASLRVLVKVGFEVAGTETSYAPARGTEIEETILRLSRRRGHGRHRPQPDPRDVPPMPRSG